MCHGLGLPTAGEQALHVRIPVRSPKAATVINQAVVEQCAAIRIERVFGCVQLIDAPGIELHPLLRPLQIDLMQRNVGAVVRKRVRRGRDSHALERARIGHAIGHHAGDIGLPCGEDHLEHGLDLRLSLHAFGWLLLGCLRIGHIEPWVVPNLTRRYRGC